jgi:CRISPR type IV-associated protein Csf3
MVKLKINANLAGPLILNGSALCTPFDSILAYLAVERAKVQCEKPLEIQQMVDIIESLPLEKIATGGDYLNAASMVSLHGEHAHDAVTIYKSIRVQRFLDAGIDSGTVVDGVRQRFIAAGSGSYKTGAPSLYPRLANSASWTVRGDKEKIIDLLRNWTHIGKKSALGFGRIKDYAVTDASKDDPIIRPLPVDYFDVIPLSFMRLKPAYWIQDGRMLSGVGDITRRLK